MCTPDMSAVPSATGVERSWLVFQKKNFFGDKKNLQFNFGMDHAFCERQAWILVSHSNFTYDEISGDSIWGAMYKHCSSHFIVQNVFKKFKISKIASSICTLDDVYDEELLAKTTNLVKKMPDSDYYNLVALLCRTYQPRCRIDDFALARINSLIVPPEYVARRLLNFCCANARCSALKNRPREDVHHEQQHLTSIDAIQDFLRFVDNDFWTFVVKSVEASKVWPEFDLWEEFKILPKRVQIASLADACHESAKLQRRAGALLASKSSGTVLDTAFLQCICSHLMDDIANHTYTPTSSFWECLSNDFAPRFVLHPELNDALSLSNFSHGYIYNTLKQIQIHPTNSNRCLKLTTMPCVCKAWKTFYDLYVSDTPYPDKCWRFRFSLFPGFDHYDSLQKCCLTPSGFFKIEDTMTYVQATPYTLFPGSKFDFVLEETAPQHPYYIHPYIFDPTRTAIMTMPLVCIALPISAYFDIENAHSIRIDVLDNDKGKRKTLRQNTNTIYLEFSNCRRDDTIYILCNSDWHKETAIKSRYPQKTETNWPVVVTLIRRNPVTLIEAHRVRLTAAETSPIEGRRRLPL